ncbi:MAG: hypothetical protein AB1698_01505 [Pseudomonadota bacterium]
MQPNDNGPRVLVHKEGAEGAIHLDALTGQVVTSADDRPAWAEGLVVGLLTERHRFYESRLGAEGYTAEHRNPEAIILQDLGWVALDPETGDEMEMNADTDYRMGVIAQVLGVDRENFEDDAQLFGHVLAEVEVAVNTEVSADEARAMDDEMRTTFGGNANVSEDKQSATG